MCIVAVALGGSSRIDFLLANNRDESLDRPTVAASAASVGADSSQNGSPGVLISPGTDALAGGTWHALGLGGGECRLAVLTNRTDRGADILLGAAPPARPRRDTGPRVSRGIVVRSSALAFTRGPKPDPRSPTLHELCGDMSTMQGFSMLTCDLADASVPVSIVTHRDAEPTVDEFAIALDVTTRRHHVAASSIRTNADEILHRGAAGGAGVALGFSNGGIGQWDKVDSLSRDVLDAARAADTDLGEFGEFGEFGHNPQNPADLKPKDQDHSFSNGSLADLPGYVRRAIQRCGDALSVHPAGMAAAEQRTTAVLVHVASMRWATRTQTIVARFCDNDDDNVRRVVMATRSVDWDTSTDTARFGAWQVRVVVAGVDPRQF
eukprot:TRINITY_DN11189_c0_g1_i1.p1 TRINITY_DN11189_c0_g1~~TRINITY_DN11189_c0_g1_i1.p1  ORF type:complete len:396 (-),score=89.78 TRINITY_DN11189_c0_g1_i1:32-1168(-)